MGKPKIQKGQLQQCAEWLEKNSSKKIIFKKVTKKKRETKKPKTELTYKDVMDYGEMALRNMATVDDSLAMAQERAMAAARNPRKQKLKNGPPDGINPKERTSLLKIIYGLVNKHYPKYDPSQEKSEEVSKMFMLIDQAGLGLDRKTFKKYIDAAFEKYNKPEKND